MILRDLFQEPQDSGKMVTRMRIRLCRETGGNEGKVGPFFLVMPALIALGILLLIFLGKGGERPRDASYDDLDGRIRRIEQRLARMEQGTKPQATDDRGKEDRAQVLERLERLERILRSQEAPAKTRPMEPPGKAEPPQKPAVSSSETQPIIHQVVEGDTLFKISRQYGVTLDELRMWNSIPPEEGIRTGQRLRIERQGSIQ
jgi:LysM repeat protein